MIFLNNESLILPPPLAELLRHQEVSVLEHRLAAEVSGTYRSVALSHYY